MAKQDYSIIIISTTGQTVKSAILAHYQIDEDTLKNFKDWNEVLNYQPETSSGSIYSNKRFIATANRNARLTNSIVFNSTDYVTNAENVTENTKIVSGVKIYIQTQYHLSFLTFKKNKLYNDFDAGLNTDVDSELYQKYINDIIQDEKNKPFYQQDDFYETGEKNNFAIANVSARVFVVSKALNYKVINLSPYLMECNWNDSDGGGTFSFTLGNITAIYQNEQWEKNNFNIVENQNEIEFYHSDSVNSYRILNKNMNNGKKVNTFKESYFDMILQKYDVVFIRGEKLLSEVSNNEVNIDLKQEIEIGDLINKNWDLIGLIDNTQTNFQISNGLIGYNVQGRDLMALLIDDTTLVIPNLIAINGSEVDLQDFKTNYIANEPEARKAHGYNRIIGYIPELTFFSKKPLSRIIDFIFDKMSNITLTNDINLFNEFKKNNPYKSFEEVNYQQLYLNSDVNKPATYKRLGIWNLISVWVDKSVKDRLLYDTSFATSGGKMIDFIKKICSFPLVEFYTTTMGSYFHWILRRPPIDYIGYRKNFETCNVNNSHSLNANQIYSINLSWDTKDIYSIYRYTPASGFSNIENQYVFPAIILPELLDLYGVKILEITNNYLTAEDNGVAINFEQCYKDLQYLIETNVYKQFSKKGSIIITGNRTIKKGQTIYVEPLDLLCYVTGVSNQYSVNANETTRITILEVERCIVYKYYDFYFKIVDFTQKKEISSSVTDKNISSNYQLSKDKNGKPSIWNFFMARKEYDRNNNYILI